MGLLDRLRVAAEGDMKQRSNAVSPSPSPTRSGGGGGMAAVVSSAVENELLSLLRGAAEDGVNHRQEAADALAECQSTVDESVREALSALVGPLASAVPDKAALLKAVLRCAESIMRGATRATEELQNSDQNSTRTQLKVQTKKFEVKLMQARKASKVSLDNKAKQLEHEVGEKFKIKVC